MPRNGSGVASQPPNTRGGPPNTPISSSKYNSVVDDVYQLLNDPLPITAGGTGSTSVAGAQAALSLDGKVVYSAKAANYTLVIGDNNAVIRFTAVATASLDPAATLGANWHATIIADGGDVTIDPNAAETIDGAATLIIPNGYSAFIVCSGAAFFTDYAAVNQTPTGVISINGGPLSGYRNKIINGDFDVANRATSTPAGAGFKYLTDRWARVGQNSTMAFARQEHPLGVSIPPGNPRYFGRFTVVSVAGSGNFAAIWQPIEDVRTLAGKTVTATFYAKADAAKNIGFEMYQEFGTGGSPSSDVNAIGAQQCALTTSWQRFNILVAVPSVSGKTRGTDNSDSLQLVLWLDASSAYNARASSIGQQSGTYDISHVSIVEGDARQETDPFSPRHLQQEIAICQRYYCSGGTTTWGGAATSGVAEAITVYFPVQMRDAASPVYTTTHVNASNFPAGSPAINDTTDGTHMRCSKVASGSGAASFQFTWTADAEL